MHSKIFMSITYHMLSNIFAITPIRYCIASKTVPDSSIRTSILPPMTFLKSPVPSTHALQSIPRHVETTSHSGSGRRSLSNRTLLVL
ncbi:hypothetical protein CEXT_808131 [Caerostris extrusa]|uniref:Secreted protein n=1 Tax=Caerostris extrusa TaxID=172846 RepID=A0AAV4Q3Z6_CAEEX|nr:hypothetical protein CEXT_808131 [Caerostris extrusa]